MQTYASANCGGQLSKCTPVTLFDSNDPAIVTADQAAVQMWQQAFPGYPIKTQFIDFNTLLSLIYSANAPQIFGIGWVADYPDPQDWLSLQFGPGSINNTGSVNVPAANTLMTEADVNLSASARAAQYNQAEQLLVDPGSLDTAEPAEGLLQPADQCAQLPVRLVGHHSAVQLADDLPHPVSRPVTGLAGSRSTPGEA